MQLTNRQLRILHILSDGSEYNLFAWPLTWDIGDFNEMLKNTWAVLVLFFRELITMDLRYNDKEKVWIRISPKGLRYIK